jgi:CRISPR type II-A-associated protein Csn2
MISIYIDGLDTDLVLEEPFNVALLIESKEYIRNFLKRLALEKNEGTLELFRHEQNDFINHDEIEFVQDVLFLDYNDKKIINLLNRQLKKLYLSPLIHLSDEIKKKLEETFEKIQMDYTLNIYSDIELKAEDMLKMLNISIQQDEEKRLLNDILQYISIIRELKGSNTFIFHHLSNWLEDDELQSFLHDAKLQGISIIDIEQSNMKDIFDNQFCIDSSLSLI